MARILRRPWAVAMALGALLACGGVTDPPDTASAGAGGGTASGGNPSAGSPSGGNPSAGNSSAGAPSAGASSAGASSGGAATAGSSAGGTPAGGASPLPEPLPESDGLPCDLWDVFTKACFGIGCHGSNTPGANLDMESPGIAGRPLNVPATHLHILDGSDANCDLGELLVDVENPEQSLMLTKVLGTHSCGAAMPLPPRTMTAGEITCYTEWIYRLAGKEPP